MPDTEKDPSKRNPSGFKPNPAIQEIDFEMSGHCNNPKDAHHCRTTSAWTNVFWHGNQNADNTLLLPRDKNPDSTAQMYKYMIDWQRGKVNWHVDTGSGYQRIRSQDSNQTNHLGDYCESECYIFISFWHGDWMNSSSMAMTRPPTAARQASAIRRFTPALSGLPLQGQPGHAPGLLEHDRLVVPWRMPGIHVLIVGRARCAVTPRR